MRYALIKDGVIENIISLEQRNAKDFPNAVKLDDISAAIGDTYDGKSFYHNGEKVLTYAEIIADMRTALETLGVNVDG